MKKYKTTTSNRGTTIILDSVAQAIELAKSWKIEENYSLQYKKAIQVSIDTACDSIMKGDSKLKEKVDEQIDEVMALVDDINPLFSQAHCGYETKEEGVTTTPELIASGEPMCMLDKKHTEFELVKGKGEGAYRLIINTDVSWWGNELDNDVIVGGIITTLQRFAPVELWIQQGWLGNHPDDGVTLFKLDMGGAFDITQIHFWINHPGKDIPFSLAVNCALGRKSSTTSCRAEIEADIMLRGDWMRTVSGGKGWELSSMLYTEKLDIMAQYINATCMKILTEGEASKQWFEEEKENPDRKINIEDILGQGFDDES